MRINVGNTKGMRLSRQVEVKDNEKRPCGKNAGVNFIKWDRSARWMEGWDGMGVQKLKGV